MIPFNLGLRATCDGEFHPGLESLRRPRSLVKLRRLLFGPATFVLWFFVGVHRTILLRFRAYCNPCV